MSFRACIVAHVRHTICVLLIICCLFGPPELSPGCRGKIGKKRRAGCHIRRRRVLYPSAMPSAPDLEACYRRYGPLVYRRCLRLLRSEAQAEEAMQDVFLDLVRRGERLEDRGMSSYLFRAATHVCLNRLRTRRRHPEDGDDALVSRIACDDSLEERSLADVVLAQLFGREPPSTRVMATLHYVDEMTLEEVAEACEMSVSGVRKRLRGLRARLLNLLEESHGSAA